MKTSLWPCWRGGSILRGLALLVAVIMAAATPTPGFAEGSRSLYPSTYNPAGSRADLDLTGAANLYAGVAARRQFIYVYAQAGEYLLLGSSNRANGGDIVVYNPQSFGAKGNETIPGSANFSCGAATPPAGSFSGGALGRIAARANELAGPNSADNSVTVTSGYGPCAYLAPSSGIYGVLFSVATSGGSGPTGSIANLHVGNTTVAAWDVTVRAGVTSTTDINARVFTYGLIAFTGGNNQPVYHTLFYATPDGSRYQQDMQGLDPAGYALWGSTSGFLDNGQPLYNDIRGNGALVNAGFPAGITAQLPQAPIFFSTIDPSGANASQAAQVLQILGIPLSPPTPQLTNPAFSGVQSGNQTYVGGGGTFTFTTQNLTSYLIVISAGSDYDPGNPANATLSGLAPDGVNTVPWNGLNNGGTAFPTGTFNFRIVGRNGEIHFPIIDAEGNATGGPTVTKLNGVTGDHTVYYNDRGYLTRNNVAVGTLNGLLCPANPPVPPTPDHALLGQDSSAKTFSGAQCHAGVGTCYYRYWPGNGNANTDCAASAGFGDAKGLDLWTYQQTTPQILPIVINPTPPGPTVATSVSVPPTAYPGATVNGSFNFRNVGGMTATGVTYSAVVGTPGNCPTNLAFPLLPAGVTFTYNTSTCAVTFNGMPTTLTAGQSLNFNFSYTAPASGSVPVSTTINSGNGGSANAAGTTTIIVADVTTSISVPPTAPGGSTVSGTITYGNAAAATATANGVTYAATIGTSGSCPVSVMFPVLPTGVTASYNTSSCQVTFSGFPTSLTPGQTFTVGFQYTGPNSGTVPASSAITTSTPESNTANNTSSGVTVFSAPANVTLSKAGPATATQGQNFSYTLTATNNGQSATAATVIVQDQLPANLIAQSVSGANCGTLPSAAGALLTCSIAGPIAASGGMASFTLTVSAASTGAITNYAATNPLGSGNPPSPPGPGCNTATTSCASAQTTVNALADLAVTKTASPAGTYLPGQSLNYTITVSNGGPSDVSGVSVADTVPATVTVSGWTCSTASAGADCDTTSAGTGASGTGNAIALNNVLLPAGASISIAVNGTAALSATGPITNSVTATPPAGASCSTPPCARTAQVTNTNTGAPQLSIAKSATPGAFAVGQTGTYSLLIGNSGSSATVAPITVTDPLPAGITTTATPSGTGWDCSASASTQISCTTVSVLLPGSNAPVINAPVTIAAGTASPATNTATVDGGGDASCPAAAHCASTIQTPVNAPLIDVTKTLSGSLIVGVPANYVITATNNGQAATLAGTITDTIPTGLTIGTLPAGCSAGGQAVTCVLPAGIATGGSVSYTIPVTPQAATDGSNVSNTAVANGGGDPSCPGAGHCDGTTTNTVTAPQLQLIKTANPATFVVAQPASYTLTLTNTGTAATTAVTTITDTVPTGLTLGTLPAGCTASAQAVTCTIASGLATMSPVSFMIPVTPQAGVNGQSVVNTAGATGGGDPGCVDGTPLSGLPARCVGSVTTPVNAPQLTIVKTASGASFVVGVPASYTLQVTNTGTATTTSASTVTDVIPGGLAIDTLPVGCTASGQQVTCTIASGFLTNSPVSFVIPVTPTAGASGTTLSNTATVSGGGDPTCPTTGNCTSTVTTPVNAPQLSIVKTASAASFVVGVPATYTLQVTNTGTAATTAVTTVTDNVPGTLTLGTLPAGCSASGQAVTCTIAAGLATNSPVSFVIPVTPTAAASGTTETNTATVSGGGDPTCPAATHCASTVTTPVNAPQLTIVKTASTANFVVGVPASYTLRVTNTGTAATTAASTVTDNVPSGLILGATPASCSASIQMVTCTISAGLAPGAANAVSFVIPVTPTGAASGNTLSNTATVLGGGDPTCPAATHCASTVTTPVNAPQLTIVKTASTANFVVGVPASYTVQVTNAGTAATTAVSTVTDNVPGTLTLGTLPTGCSASGQAVTCTIAAGLATNSPVSFVIPVTPQAAASGTTETNTATVSGGGDPTCPAATHCVSTVTTPVNTVADLAVVKTGPATVTAGGAISYTIRVSNNGPSDTSGATFSDPVPAGITGVTASCGAPTNGAVCGAVGVVGSSVSSVITSLPAGGSVTFTISGTAPTNGTTLTNTATIMPAPGTTDPNLTNNGSSAATTVTASADVSIVKTGPATIASGATISYTLLIANAGPSAADGATWSDIVPAGITGVTASCGSPSGGAACAAPTVAGNTVSGAVATFPANSSITITISGIAPFGAQTLNNTAMVTPPPGVPDPNAGNNSSSASTTIGAAADIALTKTVDNAAPNVGQQVTFTITAQNNGPNDATGVAVTDSLPSGLGFVSATPAQGSYASATGLWTIGSLANGASTTLTIVATVNQPGGLTNTVAVSASDQPDPNTSNNNAGASVNAGASADIGVAKTVDNAAPNVGAMVTYTLTATNHGPNDATGIEITDQLPAGVSFVSAAPAGAYNVGSGVWTVGALANGAAATLAITVNVTAPGSITNAATITHEDQFDPVGANNQAGVTINGQQADLAVTKTVDNATPNVGSNVTFSITVHNNGPSDATNVALTDNLPVGLAFVSAAPSQGSYAGATGLWTVGTLTASGATSTATLTMVATVTQAGAQTNTASVSASDQPDPNTTNNSGSASLNGNPQADLALVKSGPATVTPGNIVAYTIIVTNNGPSAATNVAIADPTPAGLTFVGNSGACTSAYPCSLATLANGASATITSTYSVPANYAGANPIVNTASVTSDTPDPDTTNNQGSSQTQVGPGNADLAIVKTGPATVSSGGAVGYTLTIINNGPSPANGASYSDAVPAAITGVTATCGSETGGAACASQPTVSANTVAGTVGTLPSGSTVIVTIGGVAPQGPASLSNTATVTPPNGVNDPNLSNNSSSVSTNVGAPSADLAIVKTGPAQVMAGSSATYALTVTNNGPDVALAAQVTDPTPAGLTFMSASTPCQGGFPCTIGDLPNGASTIVTVTFAVPSPYNGANIVNTAGVSSSTADPNLVNNTSTVTTPVVTSPTSADLSLTKTGPASVAPGGSVAYTIVVSNAGSDAAVNVVVSDPTPTGLTFVANSGACATAYPCALGSLANGASATIISTYALPANYAGANPIVNTANVGSDTPDPNPGNNSGSAATPVIVSAASADLSVSKTGPATAGAGSTVVYTLVVTNHGPDAVPDAMLADPTPPGLTYVSAGAPCAGAFPCTIGALANGASATFSATYTVNAGFSGSIANIASVSSATVPDPVPNNNTGTATTTVSGGNPPPPVTPVPVDARWMLALMGLLLVLIGAPRMRRRR